MDLPSSAGNPIFSESPIAHKGAYIVHTGKSSRAGREGSRIFFQIRQYLRCFLPLFGSLRLSFLVAKIFFEFFWYLPSFFSVMFETSTGFSWAGVAGLVLLPHPLFHHQFITKSWGSTKIKFEIPLNSLDHNDIQEKKITFFINCIS